MIRATSVALLAAVAVAAAVAAAATAAAATLDDRMRVTLIGDSVATALEWNPAAIALLRDGIDLDVQVAVCRRLTGESCPDDDDRPPTLVDLAAARGAALGATVLVIAGHNDPEQGFEQAVEESVTALRSAGVARILWTTLREANEGYARMNEVLRGVAARHLELEVVDWDGYAAAHLDWFQPDGIHLRPAGGVELARLLRAATAGTAITPTSDASEPSPAPTVAPLSISAGRQAQPARVGRRYVLRLRASGGTAPYRWTLASGLLPKGLRLRAGGIVAGIPSAAGRAAVAVRVVDATGLARTRRLVLRVDG